jgi:ATP-dependent RNA helicase DDX49/DBP8
MGLVEGQVPGMCNYNAGACCTQLIALQVLDEADRLLTPSFGDDLAHLFGILPKDRQTALFTATWTPSIDMIADAPPRPGKQKPFIHRITSACVTRFVLVVQ